MNLSSPDRPGALYLARGPPPSVDLLGEGRSALSAAAVGCPRTVHRVETRQHCGETHTHGRGPLRLCRQSTYCAIPAVGCGSPALLHRAACNANHAKTVQTPDNMTFSAHSVFDSPARDCLPWPAPSRSSLKASAEDYRTCTLVQRSFGQLLSFSAAGAYAVDASLTPTH